MALRRRDLREKRVLIGHCARLLTSTRCEEAAIDAGSRRRSLALRAKVMRPLNSRESYSRDVIETQSRQASQTEGCGTSTNVRRATPPGYE